ncbi:hypothetical protein G4D82_09980 [Flavobacterium sp. CYK-4]|uniref:hypothetical protein n=1 Tax=Flavobacterium lotistagni TaxID=2709660 RepID=UPI001409DD78|nr:hypothetical protein [Flavobacterium lotistagni]NHM07549.1 hypothetical protein [Flavobacterium lotistagni]
MKQDFIARISKILLGSVIALVFATAILYPMPTALLESLLVGLSIFIGLFILKQNPQHEIRN